MDLCSRTWNLFCRSLLPALVIGLVYFVTSTLLPVALTWLGREAGLYRDIRTAMTYQWAVTILTGVLGFCVQLGVMKFALRFAQHGRVEMEHIVPDAFQFIHCLLAAFVQGVVAVVIILACVMPLYFLAVSQGPALTDNLTTVLALQTVAMGLGGLGLLFMVLLWYPSFFLILNERRDAIAALQESPSMMRGNKLSVFLAMLVVFLCMVLPLSITVAFVSRGIALAVPYGIGRIMLGGLVLNVVNGLSNLLFVFLGVATYMGIRRLLVHGIDNLHSAKIQLPGLGGPPGPVPSFGDPPQQHQISPSPANRSGTIGPPPGF
jgi:hypothetical protein